MTICIAVTGSSGFVGTKTVPYLCRCGYDVHSLKRNSKEDLRGVTAVVHLAWPSRDATTEECQEANRFTSNLLARARDANVRQFVFISSIAAQTSGVSDRVLTETDPPKPTSPYGQGKLDAEKIVTDSGVPFTILRPVAISGPNAKGNLRLLQKIAKLPVPLPLGGLRSKRSIVLMENFNLAVKTVLANDAAIGETFIVSNPQPQTVGEIVAGYRAEAGRPPGIFYFPPAPMHLIFKATGRIEMWERLNGQLIVSPAKLMSIGWQPEPQR